MYLLLIASQENTSNHVSTSLSPTDRLKQILAIIILYIRSENHASLEDDIYKLVGVGGYVLFTLDKVARDCIKQLHTKLTEEMINNLTVCGEY